MSTYQTNSSLPSILQSHETFNSTLRKTILECPIERGLESYSKLNKGGGGGQLLVGWGGGNFI